MSLCRKRPKQVLLLRTANWGEGLCLARKALIMYLRNFVTHKREVLCHNQRVLRQKLQEGDVFSVVLLDVRHYRHHLHLSLTQLALHVKRPDAVHLIAKEVYSVWHVRRE